MSLNAAAYFAISYWLLFDEFRPWMGGFTHASVVAIWARWVCSSGEEPRACVPQLLRFRNRRRILYGSCTCPIGWALDQHRLGGRGAVLIWLSFNLRMYQLRMFGFLVFAAFAAYLLIIDTPEALGANVRPFLNVYMLAYAIAIAITYLVAYLLYREKKALTRWEAYLFPAFLVAGNLFLTITVPIQAEGSWIAVTWAVEAIVLMWLSFRLGLYQLRFFSLGVFAIVVVRLLAFDTRDVDLATFRPLSTSAFSLSPLASHPWAWRRISSGYGGRGSST